MAESARSYGTGSLEFRWTGSRGGSLDVLGYGGWSADTTAGSWLGGEASGEIGRRFGGARLGLGASVAALRYLAPFTYRDVVGSLQPFLATSVGRWDLRLQGDWSRGRWQEEVASLLAGPPRPVGGRRRVGFRTVDGMIGTLGADASAIRHVGGLELGLSATGLDADNAVAPGTYAGGGLSLGAGDGPWAVFGRVQVWSVPAVGGTGRETQIDALAGASISLGTRWTARLAAGRSARDPLYGTRGTTNVTAGVAWRIPLGVPEGASIPVVEMGEAADGGRRARFRVVAPDARSVELAGDFNGWNPEPMTRSSDAWVLERVLSPGLQHFAFRVDGATWMVPDDAPGVADDGWGRRTASVVVEPM